MRAYIIVALSGVLSVVGCTTSKTAGPNEDRASVKHCDDSWEFGRGAKYSARWVTETRIVIIAEGDKPGSAYDVCLGEQNIEIFPPRYELRWKSRGTGTAQQTPFTVQEQFNVARGQKSVSVKDRDGDHQVPIKDR